ncbi:MAG: thiolase family protein [Lautropia sp.]
MNGRSVYVRGVGYHPFGRHPGTSLKQLAATAALAALDDAGLSCTEVDAAFCANAYAGMLNGQESIRGETWLRTIGFGKVAVFNVENACASGGSAVHLASLAIAAGAYDDVLVLGAEKMFVNDTARTLAALATSADTEVMSNIGMQFVAVDAIRVKEVMASEGLDDSALEWVAAKNHDNGVHNPMAQFRKPMTMEQVRASRMISDPIRLFMCSAISDGAAAVVLSSRPGRGGVRVRASAVASSPVRARDGAKPTPALAAEAAYAQAGLGPADLDFAEVHDAVAPAELMYYHELGFCKAGEVGRFVRERRSALDGAFPVNPSGGLSARGHPVGATGVAQIAELALQLRGDAHGRQVQGARLALAHNAGGWIGEDPAVCVVHILQSD